MIEQFTSYFTKLEQLSGDELLRSAEKLVVSENTAIAKLIAHLAEMASRKTALKLGYKSLFDYCISSLNLSEGAVPARIHVANVALGGGACLRAGVHPAEDRRAAKVSFAVTARTFKRYTLGH